MYIPQDFLLPDIPFRFRSGNAPKIPYRDFLFCVTLMFYLMRTWSQFGQCSTQYNLLSILLCFTCVLFSSRTYIHSVFHFTAASQLMFKQNKIRTWLIVKQSNKQQLIYLGGTAPCLWGCKHVYTWSVRGGPLYTHWPLITARKTQHQVTVAGHTNTWHRGEHDVTLRFLGTLSISHI